MRLEHKAYIEERILDFDIETVAAGFADPQWVPQKVTCIAWSWVGSDKVEAITCGGSAGLYEKPELRRRMLGKFLAVLDRADVVTGHNLIRFDLPVLNADCIRLGLAPLGEVRVEDTMRIVRTKGLKKGLDNLSGMLKTLAKKEAKDWQEWEDAYAVPGWPEVISRARSDVALHKEVRAAMIERGIVKPAVLWRP